MNEQRRQPAVNNETENEETERETDDTDTQSLASEEALLIYEETVRYQMIPTISRLHLHLALLEKA